jgi:2-acylglycerol O-acyltransferase 2
MLKRGDSDFQWLKARTESLHSSLTSEYSEMTASSVPLNAETSQPQERAEHNLPPKSYADAIFNTASESGDRADAKDASNSAADGQLENHTGHTAGNVNGFPPVNNDIPKPTNSEEVDGNKVHKKRTGGEDFGKDKAVYEINHGGERLTSVKLDESYEKNLERDRETAPREKKKQTTMETIKKKDEKPHLASGRRAGAGWERSA